MPDQGKFINYQRLGSLLKASGVENAQIVELCDCTRQTAWKILKGDYAYDNPPHRTHAGLVALAEQYDVEIPYVDSSAA